MKARSFEVGVTFRFLLRNWFNNVLLDWYAHKKSYPWLLPGFNRTLSRMPDTFWNSTPHDSNLVETAHVATNKSTDIKLTPLEAIEKYEFEIFTVRVVLTLFQLVGLVSLMRVLLLPFSQHPGHVFLATSTTARRPG